MIKNDYWEQFNQTGNIYDYLAFKLLDSESEENTNREIVDVDNNSRSSNS